MKIIKRSLLFLLMIVSFMVGASTFVEAYNLIPIQKPNGEYINYRGTAIQVKMPDQYVEQDSDFRAVWISHLVSDIAPFTNETQYKAEMERVFKVMEYYNLNAMIFHVRMNNDALYRSNLNPIARYYSSVDFDEFDPLAWIIEESHKRGIEFHAWMNPYRISTAREYPATNAASNPDNLLTGTSGTILNPGEPAVRQFLVNTVMELVNNYDVDGIHFDDYFYISGADDTKTRAKYNFENLSLGDFRRKQVDLFIQELSTKLRTFSQANNRVVQLGISPSGIYRNGGYVASNDYTYDDNGNLTYPLFSNSSGFAHYDNYLYADTKKWIDNEWIDYILPQIYWAIDHPVAGFAGILDWWNKVVEYKDVNLYVGMGLYMVNEGGAYGWNNNRREAANQVQFASQHKNVDGFSIYSFKHLDEAYRTNGGGIHDNMKNIKNEMWTKPSLLPEIKTFPTVTLNSVSNLKLSKTSAGYRIDFDENTQAKFYGIYRSTSPLTFSSSELIDIIGDYEYNGVVSYIDEVSTSNNYYYGVKPFSKTNTPGNVRSLSTTSATQNGELLPLEDFNNLYVTDNTFFNETINVKWDTVFPLYDGVASYEVYKSLDGINWTLATTPTNPISSTNTSHSQKIRLDSESAKLYVKVKAYNRISESFSDVIEVDVVKKIGTITNFTVTKDVYANDEVEFKWNLFKNLDGVIYKVQYSKYGNTWIDITTDANPIEISGVNATQKFTLPNFRTNYLYRVVAENSEGRTISKTITIDAYKYLGDFDFTVNGTPYTFFVNVNEGEAVNITWDNLKYYGENASYIARMSYDLENWQAIKIFNTKNTLIVGDDSTTLIIYPDFRYYTLYLMVEAILDDGRSYSQIIEFRVSVNHVTPRFFLDHFNRVQEAFYNSMDIYK